MVEKHNETIKKKRRINAPKQNENFRELFIAV